MLLLSSQKRSRHHSKTSNVSSSPSFWIAQAVGALLVCPPDLIERWLPMVAPFPTSIYESQKRNIVNQLLEECWNDGISHNDNNIDYNSYNSRKSAYEIQVMDEWIVDNQRQIRNEEIKGENQEEPFNMKVRQEQDVNTRKSSSAKPKLVPDSLFSNYFLSLHLLFSLPSFGQEEDRDSDSDGDHTLDTRINLSSMTMKPSTYGEITPLGTRQLFGAMGLLDHRRNTHNRDSSSSPCFPAYHFFDLGSGEGKLVAHAFLELSSSSIERATGIELSPSRHQSALSAKQALIELLDRKQKNRNENSSDNNTFQSPYDTNEIDKKIELIEGDLFDIDLSTATHIYVASLCFPDNLMLRLEEMLAQRIERQYHEGSKESVAKLQWIATLRQFPNDLGGIQPIVRFMEMSWTSPLGSAVYLYQCDN